MECNILVIKPQVFNPDEYLVEISNDLRENDFEIVALKRRHLNEDEFKSSFICKNDEHLRYMTSRPVVALLYRGPSAVEFGRNYKNYFRNKYNAPRISNILHTCEPGNEFVIQFRLFFPDLDIQCFHQYSDQGVSFGNVTHSSDLSHLHHFDLIVSNVAELRTEKFVDITRTGRCANVALWRDVTPGIVVLMYRKLTDAVSNTATEVPILLMNNAENCNEKIRDSVRDHHIVGVVCYAPQYSLMDTEEIRAATFANGLFCVGGSFGGAPPGHIRVSSELADLLANKFF